jgi:hypothetical protein
LIVRRIRRAALLAAGSLAVIGALAALALEAGPRAAPPSGCPEPPLRDLPGETVELTAGQGLWSAWITYPPVAGERITVLWRAEGFVRPTLELTGRDSFGHRLAVEFGPSPVLPQLRGGGLQWPRAGREWGSRVLFTHAGCWRLAADAGGRRGDLSVWVHP